MNPVIPIQGTSKYNCIELRTDTMENREHRRLVLMKYCNKYLSQSNIIMKPFIRTCLNKLERKQTLKKKDINKLSQLLTFDLKMSRDQIGE